MKRFKSLLFFSCLLISASVAQATRTSTSNVHAMSSQDDFESSSDASIVFNSRVPKYEVRAVWLTTIGGIDWPHSYAQSERSIEKQKMELRTILDKLQAVHINTVLIQTRVRGTTIYPSTLEPWDGCLSGFPGKGPGYDALEFAINECHKRGMECHAWVVTIPVGRWNALGCKMLRSKFPGLIRKIGLDGFMNPEDGRTADYLARFCGEIVKNYNVDGIHLDYIRYPETWNIKVTREQGRRYITHIVEKIHEVVKGEKPWVKMSCSPIGKFDDLSRYWSHGWNAYTKVCQDAQGWLKKGLMDELFPMMYFRNEQFFPFAIDWAEQSDGKIVAPGLGIYFLDPKEGKWKIEDVVSEMYHLRNVGLGYAFFRNKFLLDNQQGIYDFTFNDFNRFLSLVPPMTWICGKKPVAPANLQVEEEEGETVVTWNTVSKYEDGCSVETPYIYNNVYASRTYPVDVDDVRNLISARKVGQSLSVRRIGDEKPLYFAVTSVDGYGNESAPAQSFLPSQAMADKCQGKARMLKCDGEKVFLPTDLKNVDVACWMVESVDGMAQKSYRSGGKCLYLSGVSEGVYVLKLLTGKGASHTVGTFFYKKNKKS